MKKILLTLLLVLSLVASAYAITIPQAFYGTASFGNGPVPDGTIITAKLNGDAVDTVTVQNGKYGYEDDLIVPDDNEEGGIITFHIASITANEETIFQSHNVTELDLTFPGTVPSGTVPTGNTTNTTETNQTDSNSTQTETPPSEGGPSGSGGSGGGGGGGSGGSSGGSSSGSNSSNNDEDDDEFSPQLFEETESNEDASGSFEESQGTELLNQAGNSEENPQGFTNLLTGAFTGIFSKTSGRLGFVAAIFILVLLGLSLARHLKKK